MINIDEMQWLRAPKNYKVTESKITVFTDPNTDLWQRTYYGFRNDNAPVFQLSTDEKYFSFTVKCQFDSKKRFDQCGVVMYLDCDNWLKASIEYENETVQRLGSVVTNGGYSDWATTDVDASIKSMWYRLSRRESDYLIECSQDGVDFKQMRICHMQKGADKIRFGVYACSPANSSFKAEFSDLSMGECKWAEHK